MKRAKKAAPTAGTVKGQPTFNNATVIYHTAPALSTAVKIILLAMQAPAHADRLRRACWDRLEQVLRRYYDGGRAL